MSFQITIVCHCSPNTRLAIDQLTNKKVRNIYQENLVNLLETVTGDDIDTEWNRIEKAIRSAASNACGVINKSNVKDHWISRYALQLMESGRKLLFWE